MICHLMRLSKVQTKRSYIQSVNACRKTNNDFIFHSMDSRQHQRLSTHILDTSVGQAAANVKVSVYKLSNAENWEFLRETRTDQDGRCAQLLQADEFPSGTYKLAFDVGSYFKARNVITLYPVIEVVVDCVQQRHYHIPLLVNPYGYSTYRGT